MTSPDLFAHLPGAEAHFTAAEPNRIHYVTVGRGNHTLVLVHGWACSLKFWREQVPTLAEHARLVLIDLPGHGRSDKPQADYTMDFFGEAVLAVLRDAHVDRATFIGHSMGAAALCRVHHHAPEKIAGMISVDGLLCRLPSPPEETRALTGGLASSHYLEHARAFISTFFPIPGTEALRDQVTAEMLVTPQHVMLGAMVGMLDTAQPDWMLQKVNAPVIVLNAPTPWWTPDYKKYVHALSPQTDYTTMENTGHFLMLEKPLEFNALLLEKLEKFGLISQ
jgi:pimeloyl-ACP methyl ester carboxylesterase